MRFFVSAVVAVAVLGVSPAGHATASPSGQIFGGVHVLQRSPAGNGCELWSELGIDVHQPAGDDPGAVTVYMNFGHVCGADVSIDGQVGAYDQPLDSMTVEFEPSAKRIRLVGQLVADTWPSGEPSLLDVDVTITDPGNKRSTAGTWAGTATGRVIGPLTFDMATVHWTGWPTTPAPPAEWAAAYVSKTNPAGHVTGPRPIGDPAWRSGGPPLLSAEVCGDDETGQHHSQLSIWMRSPASGQRLQALHLRTDPACQYMTAVILYGLDAALPDGSLDQSKVAVIAAAPGTDAMIVPSMMNGTGLHDMRIQQYGLGGLIDPCDPTLIVDYVVTSTGLTPNVCP